MKLSPRSRAAGPVLLAILLSAASTASAVPFSAPYVPGELLVGFREGTPGDVRRAVHAVAGAFDVESIARGQVDLARFDENLDIAAVESRYLADPTVEFAERNYWGEGGFTPNDTHFPSQWQHDNTGQFGGTPGADMNSESGWDVSRGSASVTVAVLDSGIDSDHPEFGGRILPGWDFVNNDANPEDDHSHGTYVSGLLAANANNGFAVAGVDHFCMILPIKVLNAFNAGTTANLISGIDFATQQGADVISMSLINYPCGSGLNNALNAARAAGLVLIACAGNGGIGDADISCPGASPHTIAIGATTNTDARAFYSGTGQDLEFMAPGDDVITVLYNSHADGFTFFNGCSAATPNAAGIVSILRSFEPGLRNSHVRDILQSGAEDQVGPPQEDTAGWDEFFGWGRLNLRLVLDAFLAATAAPDIASGDSGVSELAIKAGPNPAREQCDVRYALPTRAWVRVEVLDVAGRRVAKLDEGIRNAGEHELQWSAPGAGGIYFVRVQAGEESAVRKVTMLR